MAQAAAEAAAKAAKEAREAAKEAHAKEAAREADALEALPAEQWWRQCYWKGSREREEAAKEKEKDPDLEKDAICCVCGSGEVDDDDELLLCERTGCGVAAHRACYDVEGELPKTWLCDLCEAKEDCVACDLCGLGPRDEDADGPWQGNAMLRCAARVVVPPPLNGKRAAAPLAARARRVEQRVARADRRVPLLRRHVRLLALRARRRRCALLLDALQLAHQLLRLVGVVVVVVVVAAVGRRRRREPRLARRVVRVVRVDDRRVALLAEEVVVQRRRRRERLAPRRRVPADRLQVLRLALLQLAAEVPALVLRRRALPVRALLHLHLPRQIVDVDARDARDVAPAALLLAALGGVEGGPVRCGHGARTRLEADSGAACSSCSAQDDALGDCKVK